jgi:dolichol-phosphate mannosyltransferase
MKNGIVDAARPFDARNGDDWRQRPRRIIVVLPAFNEALRIGVLLHHIHEAMAESRLSYQVVVVNDGSTDATEPIVRHCAEHMPITLERHATNLGLGATIRDGLSKASEIAAEQDIIITMDADDTHTPGLILRMIRMISEGYDVVIASRYQHESLTVGVPLSRRLLSRGASLLMRAVFPIRGVRDYTCGFRAYRARILKQAIERYGRSFMDQEGFQCMVDILLKLRKMPLIFGEVPFVLRYDHKEGGSKMNVAKTVWKTILLLVKRRFGHL